MTTSDKQLQYIFYICLAIGFYFQMLNLTTPLLDEYSFRQTQTAITSFWFLKEGFQWAYQTPVFGLPWSVPMEFPLYQYMVYMLVKIFNIENLDLAGRLVSLIFYYAIIYPLWQILKILEVNKVAILYIAIILVTSPIFIFWSRTFMIESAGLYFTLMFILYLLRYDKLKFISTKTLLLIFLFGTLAVLTKITTLLVGFIFVSLYLLFYGRIKVLFSKKNILGIIVVGVVVSIGLLWNDFADTIKSSNSLSSFLISSNLSKWNFGTLAQRMDLLNYKQMFIHAIHNISYLLFLFIFIPSLACCQLEYKKLIFVGFLTFIISFMTLFNLYKVHSYYWYANSLFAIISLGLIVYFICEKLKNNIWKLTLLLTIISVNLFGYYSYYYESQTKDFTQHPTVIMGDIIKQFTLDNDVLITMGLDWNSEVPYYAQRKAIMLRGDITPSSKEFQQLYQRTTQTNNIGAVVICGVQPLKDELLDIINSKTFGKVETNNCNIYINNTSDSEMKKYLLTKTTLTQNEKLFFDRKNTLKHVKVELDSLNIINATRDGNRLTAQNNDMYFIFPLPDECAGKQKIGLEVNLSRESSGLAQVFYKSTQEEFSEKNSVKKDFPNGEMSMQFLFENKNISLLRIDSTEKKETVQLNHIQIYCEGSK